MYIEIPAVSINVGKALKKSLFTLIRDNFIDHETRINSLESGATRVEAFNFELMGSIEEYKISELQQIGTHYATADFTLTAIEIRLMNNPGFPVSTDDGILSVDVEISTDGGVTWATILVNDLSIGQDVSTTGETSDAANFITNGEDITVDDILRVNVKSKKDTQGSFLILAYGEVS